MIRVRSMDNLVRQLSRLPGIGPKTAQRLAYRILSMPEEDVRQIAAALIEVREKIVRCPVCRNITEATPCALCEDLSRSRDLLCVVEEPRDVAVIEKSGRYKGLYHVLHGVISPMDDVGPEELGLDHLGRRVREGAFTEVILALNPSVEGEATAMYIARMLKSTGVSITRLAHGLPIGGELEYADELTLSYAFDGRKEC